MSSRETIVVLRSWMSRAPRSDQCRSAVLAGLLVALLTMPLVPTIAAADTDDESTDPEDQENQEGDDEAEVPDDFDEIDADEFEVTGTLEAYEHRYHTGGNPAPLILWPQGRRAYQFGKAATSSDNLDPGGQGVEHVVAYDLDTLEPVTDDDGERLRSEDLSPPGPDGSGDVMSRWRLEPQMVAVDEDRGVMFFPHQREVVDPSAGPCFDTAMPVPTIGTDFEECVGGIHVLDLTDDALAPLPMEGPDGQGHNGRIPFQPIGIEGVMQSPVLRAMSHSDLGGGGGKLHLLVQETAHWMGTVDAAGPTPQDVVVPHWIVQIDVDTGATDWVESAPGCTSFKGPQNQSAGSEPGNALFVGGDAAEPRLYVGCYGSGQIGSVGMLELDANSVDNAPTGSASFPGPAGVASIQADEEADRLWLRSHSGGDETWWYFDGGVGTYLGVVGIGRLGEGGIESMGHLDPATGRLYVMRIPSRNNQREVTSEGGLFVTDGRRVPVPQAGVVRDLPWDDLMHLTARNPETGDIDYERDENGERTGNWHVSVKNPMVVDPADEVQGRPRRLFFRAGIGRDTPGVEDEDDSERWYVIADRRPVQDALPDTDQLLEEAVENPPPTDDVELSEGLVAPTFLGSARGYGLRATWLGGADAAVVPGPAYGHDQDFTYEGLVKGENDNVPFGDLNPCSGVSREFSYGVSGSLDSVARLESGSSSGAAAPQVFDSESHRDLADPVGRCGAGLFGLLQQLPATVDEQVDEQIGGPIEEGVFDEVQPLGLLAGLFGDIGDQLRTVSEHPNPVPDQTVPLDDGVTCVIPFDSVSGDEGDNFLNPAGGETTIRGLADFVRSFGRGLNDELETVGVGDEERELVAGPIDDLARVWDEETDGLCTEDGDEGGVNPNDQTQPQWDEVRGALGKVAEAWEENLGGNEGDGPGLDEEQAEILNDLLRSAWERARRAGDGVRTPGTDDVDDRPGHEPDEGDVSCHAPEFGDDGSAQPSTEDRSGDDTPAGSVYSAQVRCNEDLRTDGQSRARFVTAGPVNVIEAGSTYDLTRDTDTGGLVGTAHAWARGVSIVDEVVAPNGEVGTSEVHIDLVETRAEAWAEGRSQPNGVDDDCDRDRTAGTCLEVTMSGVTIVDGRTGEVHRCDDFDQCEQNEQMAAGMDAALGSDWQVNLREPDPLLARGMPNGTQAAIQKREIDEFSDIIMKGDLLKTLPGLEMVRYNDRAAPGRGRQIYQFAGVEIGTTYTRQCRGVVEGDQCVQRELGGPTDAEVEVTLTDAVDGTPLPDGMFGLHRDDEGTLGQGLDVLPGKRTCTTDAQGICTFTGLDPGAYTLVQAGAPGDYAPTDEQVPLNLSPGSLFEVDVTNVRDIGEVEVTLTDLDEQPLEGGVFELYADANTDGAIGLDDPQAATCTTDPGGTCTMSGLPLDAYVLRQAAAPEGYAPVEDEVPFALDAPGQVATVGFSNAPALPPSDDGGAGDAVDGSQQAAPPQQGSFNGVERTVPMPVHQPVAVQGPLQPQVASDSGSGGPSIIQQMKDAPGDAIRMIRRSPREAAGFAALVLLAGAAVNGPVRRRLLTQTMA